jgi:putative lipoic acid-binding regulatory protein
MGSSSAAKRQCWDRFQALLDESTEWPSEYLFKFIVPRDNLNEVRTLFRDLPLQVRESRKGNYVGVTARLEMHSSDEVIAIYTSAAKIDDIILL